MLTKKGDLVELKWHSGERFYDEEMISLFNGPLSGGGIQVERGAALVLRARGGYATTLVLVQGRCGWVRQRDIFRVLKSENE